MLCSRGLSVYKRTHAPVYGAALPGDVRSSGRTLDVGCGSWREAWITSNSGGGRRRLKTGGEPDDCLCIVSCWGRRRVVVLQSSPLNCSWPLSVISTSRWLTGLAACCWPSVSDCFFTLLTRCYCCDCLYFPVGQLFYTSSQRLSARVGSLVVDFAFLQNWLCGVHMIVNRELRHYCNILTYVPALKAYYISYG